MAPTRTRFQNCSACACVRMSHSGCFASSASAASTCVESGRSKAGTVRRTTAARNGAEEQHGAKRCKQRRWELTNHHEAATTVRRHGLQPRWARLSSCNQSNQDQELRTSSLYLVFFLRQSKKAVHLEKQSSTSPYT